MISLAETAGKLTASSMCAVIAHLQPDKAIIVDESLTSGGAYWNLSKVSAPTIVLQLLLVCCYCLLSELTHC